MNDAFMEKRRQHHLKQVSLAAYALEVLEERAQAWGEQVEAAIAAGEPIPQYPVDPEMRADRIADMQAHALAALAYGGAR